MRAALWGCGTRDVLTPRLCPLGVAGTLPGAAGPYPATGQPVGVGRSTRDGSCLSSSCPLCSQGIPLLVLRACAVTSASCPLCTLGATSVPVRRASTSCPQGSAQVSRACLAARGGMRPCRSGGALGSPFWCCAPWREGGGVLSAPWGGDDGAAWEEGTPLSLWRVAWCLSSPLEGQPCLPAEAAWAVPVQRPWRRAHTLPLCPAELSIAYSSGTAISLVQVGPGPRSRRVQEWREPLHLQDVDWQRAVLYGTDDRGTLLRVVGHPGRRETIVTGLPGEIPWGAGAPRWHACFLGAPGDVRLSCCRA